MVEDSHGESDLRKLLVRHYAVWLEASVLGRPHAREIHAVFGTPIVFLEISEVIGHHCDVGSPVFLESYENAHSYGVYSGLSHAVESVASPVEIGFHSTRVVDVVMCSVVGLLEAYYTVESVADKFLVPFYVKRHYLDFQI